MRLSDRRYAALITSVAFAAAAGLYIWAWVAAGHGRVFGGLLFNPIDGNTYLAKAYQGFSGAWRFHLPYTAEPGGGAYINLYYLFIGHVARWTGFSIPIAYNLARLAGAGLLLAALWRFYKAVLQERRSYRSAYAISALTLGMGWLLIPAGVVPMDLWVAETYPLLAALTNPHFPMALGMVVILANPESTYTGRTRFIRDAVLAFFLALVSPFGVFVALLPWTWELLRTNLPALRDRSFSVAATLRSHETARILAILAGGLPVVLYDLAAIRSDLVLSMWDSQNVTNLPPWWDVALSPAPSLLLAAAGFRESPDRLRGWFALGLLLAVLPIGLQRRFLMGLYIPLAGMSGVGFASLRRPAVRLLVIGCFIPGPLILLLTANAGIQMHSPLLYLAADEAAAMHWIETQADPDVLVLAAPETGLFLPAYTGRRVIYGHPFETVNADAEREAVEAFFSAPDAAAGAAFLIVRGVDFVFYGPRERLLGTLTETDLLELVYSGGSVRIYQVTP
jgi:hypothetical protein